MGGVSPNSESLKIAGERGYIPMTLNLSTPYAVTHWNTVLEGAARSGRSPSRQEWRVAREVFVADTDAEARRWALEGHMGRMYREFLLPQFRNRNILHYLKQDPDVPDEDVTTEYLVDNVWLVGSVGTVADKLTNMYKDLGGFGTLIILCFDYKENPEAWRRSMELLAREVKPRVVESLTALSSGG
jgi:alkanesulfonate monooxygenase SsuD/methylene tetrahydromethanopterin reductase-like flavin-dependent oxidoreductase (luciferase family)